MIRNNTKNDAAAFGFSVCNSGTDNVTALQNAVDANTAVTVTQPGIYDMTGTVKLPSDTHLSFSPGVILRRIGREDPAEEGNLFINEGAYDGRYNENISLCGLHLLVNGVESAPARPDCPNVIPGLRGHLAFLYIRNLLLTDIMITDLCPKDYAIQISDFENAEIARVHIEGLKDGIHFGPGRHFIVRDSRFRTYDDAIALNCADYSVSNPNCGSIEDGLIENCTELPGYTTEAFFIRILVGTARKWEKGMTVYHSDAILTEKGMYRVIMRPDNTPYVSVTEPDCGEGYQEKDGILWYKTHKGYRRDEIHAVAGCRNITVRNVTFLQARRRAIYIYTSFDEYLHSYYRGSEIPFAENIRLEDIHVLQPIAHFLATNIKTENIVIRGGNISREDILTENNPQM